MSLDNVNTADPAFVNAPYPLTNPAYVPSLPWVTVRAPLPLKDILLFVDELVRLPIVCEKVFITTNSAGLAPNVTAPVLTRALSTPDLTCPALMVVPPVYVFWPVKVRAANPVFVNDPVPLITPPYVTFALVLTVNPPSPRVILPPLEPPPDKLPMVSADLPLIFKIAPAVSANTTLLLSGKMLVSLSARVNVPAEIVNWPL